GMSAPLKKKKKEKRREEGQEEPTLFGEKLAKLKRIKLKYDTANAEQSDREAKVFRLESSFLADFKEYQEAAVKAGIIKDDDKTRDLGRLFSGTSTTWLEKLKKNPELAEGVIAELEKKEAPKSSKKSEKSRKRKR
ncbi:hypothetical protein PFISCL1PPCAC_23716, partial [Pristionchus fissidentatus]